MVKQISAYHKREPANTQSSPRIEKVVSGGGSFPISGDVQVGYTVLDTESFQIRNLFIIQ